MQSPRMRLVWKVLEAAKDNNDQWIIAKCRKCIEADRLGWEKHGGPQAFQTVVIFAEDMGL